MYYSEFFVSTFSQIILMVADDMACNPRNPRPGMLDILQGNCFQAISRYMY